MKFLIWLFLFYIIFSWLNILNKKRKNYSRQNDNQNPYHSYQNSGTHLSAESLVACSICQTHFVPRLGLNKGNRWFCSSECAKQS